MATSLNGNHASNSLSVSLLREKLINKSVKRSREMFMSDYLTPPNEDIFHGSTRIKIISKVNSEYKDVKVLPAAISEQMNEPAFKDPNIVMADVVDKNISAVLDKDISEGKTDSIAGAIMLHNKTGISSSQSNSLSILPKNNTTSKPKDNQVPNAIVRRQNAMSVKPDWHAPWKLMRVISGHLGWVRSVTVEPGNEWFATGAGDRTIKIWDLASGTLKVSLTGHIATVRGLAVSPRHPYLFSCAEDKMVKCWDLETNKVIRHYHGHLSGVYSLSLHPTLDVLVTAGRDSTARVWDMRTKQNIHVLSGHKNTVSDVKCQEGDPQVITASMDSTIRLWDLAAGKTLATLTHHKKSVRTLALHPTQFMFASGSPDNIKQWKCPEGTFVQNFDGQRSIINTLSINQDNVMFSGGDNGSIGFWDWKSGYMFQKLETTVQPGSLESEAGIFASTFDRTGLRLITCESDKTIKIWKEDEKATPETHPIDWKPTFAVRKKY